VPTKTGHVGTYAAERATWGSSHPVFHEQRILRSYFGKSLLSEEARIALAARSVVRGWVVATTCERRSQITKGVPVSPLDG
jgi:hypothetical protein